MSPNEHETTSPTTVAASPPRSLMTTAAVLGLTIGLFAGMSESPVVGVMISGVLGLISGSLVAWLRPAEDSKEERPRPPLEWTYVSVAVIPLCVTAILGGFLGVELRTGSVRNALSAERLVSLGTEQPEGKTIGNDKLVKLLLLQQSLDEFGVPVRDNNAVISRFVSDLSSADGETKALDLTDEQLLPVRRHLHDSGMVLEVIRDEHRLLEDAAEEIDGVIEQYQISDGDRVKKLAHVRRLLEHLPPEEVLTRLAVDGSDIDRMLYRLEQPELDVVLKHIRSFASSPSGESEQPAEAHSSRFSFAP